MYGITLTGINRRALRVTCPSTVLPTRSLIWTGLNPHLRLERPATKRLNQDSALRVCSPSKQYLKKSVHLHFKTSWLILCMEILFLARLITIFWAFLYPATHAPKLCENLKKQCGKKAEMFCAE